MASGRYAAFSLVEALVATVVLAMVLSLLLGMISQTSTVTQSASQKITAFQSARAAFDLMARNLSQATLNAYWDYDQPVSPTRYLRRSELHFLIGAAGVPPFPGTEDTGQAIFFQAPGGVTGLPAKYGGLETLLNAFGYFVSYRAQDDLPAPFSAPPVSVYRYRLMQAIQPTENLRVYDSTTGNAWLSDVAASASPIADNIICLVVWSRRTPEDDPAGLALSSTFAYDSRLNALDNPQPATGNQLPPTVQLTIVAMDETSAARLCRNATPPGEIASALSGLFRNVADYENDLAALEGRLAAGKINFRTFTVTVPLRESKME